MEFQDTSVLVTGGSRGIGRAIALAFGGRGARVAVNYAHSAEAAEETAAAVRQAGGRAIAVRADVRDLEAVRAMTQQVLAEFGSVDVLVNNAGIIRDNLVTFMKDEEWNEVLDVDLKGAFHCIKVVGREMTRRKKGRIINISSDAGLLGDMMRANYASAKAGLIGLTKTVAREFAASGVAVNAVAPGIIETDMIAGMGEAKRAKAMERIPQGRFGRPEEVAAVVLFLASGAADYLTGEVLRVDGGLNI